MIITMRTGYASPRGTARAGKQIDLPAAEAKELIKGGYVVASLDVTTTELADELVGGVWPATRERLTSAGRLGIPQVVSLGALDFVCVGPLSSVSERFSGRSFFLALE